MINKKNSAKNRRASAFAKSTTLGCITREMAASRYRFEKPLGEGAFGKVKVASLRADTTKKFAIKSIPRELFSKKPYPGEDGGAADEEDMQISEE